MTTEMIHRRSNGTVNIDFYRQQALRERAAVMSSTFRQVGPAVRPALAVLAVMAMVWALPAPRPATNSETVMLMASAAGHGATDRIASVRK